MLQFSALRFGTEPTICDGACVTLQYNYDCLSTEEIHFCSHTHTHIAFALLVDKVIINAMPAPKLNPP